MMDVGLNAWAELVQRSLIKELLKTEIMSNVTIMSF